MPRRSEILIIKERKKSIKLRKLEALYRRLPKSHPKFLKIEEELAKNKAGYFGEQSVDYYLSFLSEESYYIFHDLRLKDSKSRYFQIDTLLLSEKFIVFLEIKNITGTLFFDQDFNQLIRTFQNETQAFPDPLLQIHRQSIQLKAWLDRHKIPNIPVIPFVIISSPSTIIQTQTAYVQNLENVIHLASLPIKVGELESRFKHSFLSKREIKQISKKLLKEHEPLDPNLLDVYEIDKKAILKGIWCEKCESYSVKRIWGTWKCQLCNQRSDNAYIHALKDYSLLFGSEITNKEMREFLEIESESVSRKILTSICRNKQGKNKNKSYILPEWEE